MGTHHVVDSEIEYGLSTKIILLVGPSGAGKGSIAHLLRRDFPSLGHTVSLTTRPPRPGDIDGEQYHFVDDLEFEKRIEKGDLIEYVEFAGNKYGTLRSELFKGGIVLAELEVQGAQCIKKLCGDNVLSIFIAPPSLDALRERLIARGTEKEVEIEKRIVIAEQEMKSAHDFDMLVINHDLHQAYEDIRKGVVRFLSEHNNDIVLSE